MSSLKTIIEHGMSFEYEGYPVSNIFDGKEYSKLKVEDTLKTNYITDDQMIKIENALKKEKNLLFKSLLEIIIDTGARLGEILELEADYLIKDFTGKPVLRIYSSKNETERYIPVSRRVYWAFKRIKRFNENVREQMNIKRIFVYTGFDNVNRSLTQDTARDLLKRFLLSNGIFEIGEKNLNDMITFHSFRHTLGTDMLNNGMSIFEIQDYLGQLSSHSTAHYAKVKNPKVQKEYKSLGFVGKITKKIDESLIENPQIKDGKTLKSAALPDGACSKPINNQGNICAKFNACIICPKFITTPTHLPIHKDHLKRLQEDKQEYMKTEYIGTLEHLEKVEFALVTIIKRLEEMENVK